jgi:hypothetical protein
MDKLLEEYFLVSRCWNNEQLAVKEKMTFGRAMRILRHVKQEARKSGSRSLYRRADHLMHEIVRKQVDNPEVEATG